MKNNIFDTCLLYTSLVNGTMVYGGQNIFFAQLADPHIVHFSSEATRYFTGEFIFMIFGLPGAALATVSYTHLTPPTSAAKSTPKLPPHCAKIVFKKYWNVK